MIKIVWDAPFKQSYKKKISSNESLKTKFWNAIKIFEQNPYDGRLKTHKLTGKLNGLYAFSVGYDNEVY
jgi:mRNA-degrading endonuclease YafQ of YafQ-DinJ toxin-antitoxin module